ncbi:fibrohexamerin [Bombyx mori]|uniref:Uncharacterized protein n=1 Tax=Bombyx mori TaxID=7091 RepID=A0A8R2AR03_BOMMO|nr:fibrohexamerin [Bombyx mori]
MWFEQCLCLSVLGLIASAVAFGENLDPADDPKNIKRPCPNFDLNCIREYFSRNSQCQLVMGSVPDPLPLNYYRVDIPNSNLTVEYHDVKTRGFDTIKIIEFYINSKTEKLVLAAEVQSLKLASPKTIFKYNRKAKEPIVRSDALEVDYGTLTFTAVFPSISDLQLSNAEVFSYVHEINPKFILGPLLSFSLDSETQSQLGKLLNNIAVSLQEVFEAQGTILMTSYIQYDICDFGLELAS